MAMLTEWISVTVDGKTYKITYDYGKPPKELESAAAKLKGLKRWVQGL
ncbi:hypothetical protein [Pedobacter frigidisoli]|nr:hypothetical protein [Pedobacter frigidisoli]